MNIHEYQAKELFKQYGIPIPEGIAALSLDEALEAVDKINAPLRVVKAQIHAGGRGKGGGVKLARTAQEAKEHVRAIFGMNLVTHQTGPEGKQVNRILVTRGCDIDRELYLSAVLDRQTGKIAFMASTEGGMEIEELAQTSPEKITTLLVDPITGMQGHQARRLAFSLGLTGEAFKQGVKAFLQLSKLFIEKDCQLVEINPLVVTTEGKLSAVDAKVSFDDNATFRHPDIEALRDLTEENAVETKAREVGLSYIKLDGTIGCMVNGAGLAMATMDTIKLYGAEPANFLDVGGGANTQQVTEAFRILLADPDVKAVLVNIFGGIMKCDTIANGIVEACKVVDLNVPLVVRLNGTNVELGRKILAESDLPIITAETIAEAAQKVVKASKGGPQ